MLEPMVIDGIEFAEDGSPSDPLDAVLVRIASGDRAAFAALYDGLAGRVLGLVLRVLVDRAQSEEVLQEVFLEVWQTAGAYDPARGRARTWILTIAHRRAVDRVRSAQASVRRDHEAGLRELAASAPRVDEQVELMIEGSRAARALRALPDAQREALTLAYFGGYTQSEIAVLVGAPLGTIKTRMRDGLTRLRTEMGVRR